MKNKKGFISMTLVYSFLIIFLFLLLAILRIYSENNKFLMTIDEMVNNDLENIRLTRSNLITIILQDNVPFDSSKIDVNTIAGGEIGNGNGLYYTDDSGITDENNDRLTSRIYYFRGSVANNFVLIKNNNTCWRIVRTNEDGSIRMVYYGLADADKHCSTSSPLTLNETVGSEETHTVSFEETTTIKFNEHSNDRKFVGYMFDRNAGSYYLTDGGSICTSGCSSNVKNKLEDWYYLNFAERGINSLIADGIFCSNHEGGNNAGTITFAKYNARTYKCLIENDRLRLYKYNGGSMDVGTSLFRPIGLLTAPDVYFAGGGYNVPNNNYYLSYMKDAWLMTPYSYSNAGGAEVLTIADSTYRNPSKPYTDYTGAVVPKSVISTATVYPVVSLKPTVKVLGGSGLAANPYIVGKDLGTGEEG